jgi:hypothetical protein
MNVLPSLSTFHIADCKSSRSSSSLITCMLRVQFWVIDCLTQIRVQEISYLSSSALHQIVVQFQTEDIKIDEYRRSGEA